MQSLYTLRQLGKVYALCWTTEMEDTDHYWSDLDKFAIVNQIFVDRSRRGRHYGSTLLDKVCCDADRESCQLVLQICPDADSPLQEDALRAFYVRHGFIMWREDIMIRQPRKDECAKDPRRPCGHRYDRQHGHIVQE